MSTCPRFINFSSEVSTESPDKALEVYNQLSPSTQKIINFLISFFHQLLAPEIVEVTKMNKDNLAMVFAPSVLRYEFIPLRVNIAGALTLMHEHCRLLTKKKPLY